MTTPRRWWVIRRAGTYGYLHVYDVSRPGYLALAWAIHPRAAIVFDRKAEAERIAKVVGGRARLGPVARAT